MRRTWPLVALLFGSLARAAGPGELIDRLSFVALWDDEAFYFAARMEDLNVVGERTQLNDNVQLDDDLELYFDLARRRPDWTDPETGRRKSEIVDEQCFVIAMSAAGGTAFMRGTGNADAPWTPTPVMTRDRQVIRQNIEVFGTLNDTADADLGWSLELRLPWALLGLTAPPRDQVWGFNLLRHLRGEQDARYSYAPQAVFSQGVTRPERWGEIHFRDAEGGWIGAGERDLFIASRVPTVEEEGRRVPRPPTVDGRVEAGEWPVTLQVTVGLERDRLLPLQPVVYAPPPDRSPPLPPECDYVAREPSAPLPRGEQWAGERLVVAPYLTRFQDDPRLPGVPLLGVRDEQGAVILANQPAGGVGPWFSSLKVAWHKGQLARAAEAGIDLVLVEYWGDHDSRSSWSDAMLASLATALYELDEENIPRPDIGLRVPLEALAAEVGGLPDLTQQVTQAALYQMIRDFFAGLPPTARAVLPDGERAACVIALEQPERRLRATPSFLGFCEARFREDFGLDLLWVGSQLWGRRLLPLDGLVTLEAGHRWLVNTGGRIAAASLGPGYDDSLSAERPTVVLRNASQTLRERFRATLGERYDWLFLSSWNDYRRGDNLAASREYGDGDERATGFVTAQFNAGDERDWGIKVLTVDLPAQIASGATVECRARVANSGLRQWTSDDEVLLGARWLPDEPAPLRLPDGRPYFTAAGQMIEPAVSERGGRTLPIFGEARRLFETTLPLTAIDNDGKPLAPGRYRLRLDAVAGTTTIALPQADAAGVVALDEEGKPVLAESEVEHWFQHDGDTPLDVFLDVVAAEALPAESAAIVASSLPGRLETGQVYPVAAIVRNDGRLAWGAGYRLAARYERVETSPVCHAERPPTPLTGWIPLAGIAAAADVERVEPGQMVALPARLPVADADGLPLPLDLGPRGGCRLTLAVLGPTGQPLPTRRPHFQTVELIARDWGAGFAAVDAPLLAEAGGELACRVEVVNTAFSEWPAGETHLCWHWYRVDGLAIAYEAGSTPLTETLATGERLALEPTVTAPPATGAYYLEFDLRFPDGRLGSTLPSTFGRQTGRVPVAIVGGRYTPLAIGRTFNVAAQSHEGERSAADFDGQGNSLPAEEMPPFFDDFAGGLYPSGLLGPPPAEAWRAEVPFWFPDPRQQALNAVRAEGQPIAIEPRRAARLHLLAAAIDDPVECTLRLVTAAGEVVCEPVTVPSWNEPPSGDAHYGFATRRRVTPRGPEARRCWLHHLVVPVDGAPLVTEVVLPNAPSLRLLALTVESPADD